MASPSPSPDPPAPTPEQRQRIFADYHRFLQTSTLAACFLAPVLIALPPRKLDLYTFSLTGAFIASANYQVKDRTGSGIMGHVSRRFVGRNSVQQLPDVIHRVDEQSRFLEEAATSVENKKGSVLGERVREAWLGDKTKDWRQQRLKEEQEKLDQGEGYGSMIVDQIWQVWNQEEKKMEDVKERDEEVVRERRKQRG